MATDNEATQDTARAAYIGELEEAYSHIDSAEQLGVFNETTSDFTAAAALRHTQLIHNLRALAIELHRQAHKPFPYSEEPSHHEDLAMCHWRGYNEGLGLATRALEHLLEGPSSTVQ